MTEVWVLGVVGLLCLVFGSDIAVGGARQIARRFGISEWVIGLTVTSIGTSLPELATTAAAALGQSQAGDDSAGLAFGNILGSNIFLLTALLGATAVVNPIRVQRTGANREGFVLIGSAAMLLVMSIGGFLGRAEGLMLVGAYVVYLGVLLRMERREHPEEDEPKGDEPDESGQVETEDEAAGESAKPRWTSSLFWGPEWLHEMVRLVAGLAVIVLGADFLVDSGVAIAEAMAVPGSLIGVFIGFGTSLPEIVVSLRASSQGSTAISLGNVLGSAITNVLMCLGLSAAAWPIVVTPEVLRVDLPFALVAAVVAYLLMSEQHDLTRREGGVLVTIFGLYMTLRLAG